MKHLNKLLKILLLGPLVPLIGIPDEGDSSNKDSSNKDDSNKDENKSNDSSKDSGQGDDSKKEDSGKKDDNKSFTSEDVNKIVGERLEREKTKTLGGCSNGDNKSTNVSR